jgi:hypothetical protein
MNDRTGGLRRAAYMAVAAAATVLATGCGSSATSSGTSTSPGSYSYAQELALAQCMREHDLPTFPDPSASEGFDGSVLQTFDTSQGQAAYAACKHLLAGAPSISQLQQDLLKEEQRRAQLLPALDKFQQCVRNHGVPDFSIFSPAKNAGLNPDTPQLQAALTACQHVLPPGAHISISSSKSPSRS